MAVLFSKKHLALFTLFLLLTFLPTAFADSATTKERTITQLAVGVYEIRHPDAPDTFPQSNTTVIIGDRDVLVVDSCLLPSAAKEDIAQIRKWTNKPVSFVVNTHWHFDHTLGNATYRAAFPGVHIIAQTETAKTVAAFNPGAVARYPKRREIFQKMLDTGKDNDGKPIDDATRRDLIKSIEGLNAVLLEMKDATQLPADIVFDKEMDIDLGHRQVQLKFLGRGNTAGDTVIFLPAEKIVMTGDLIDHPVPYLFGGFPVEQIKTLRALESLGATTLVPCHGDVLHDTAYLRQMVEFLEAVTAEIGREINDGKKLQEVQEAIPKALDVNAWKQRFAGADPDSRDFFDETLAGLIKSVFNQMSAR